MKCGPGSRCVYLRGDPARERRRGHGYARDGNARTAWRTKIAPKDQGLVALQVPFPARDPSRLVAVKLPDMWEASVIVPSNRTVSLLSVTLSVILLPEIEPENASLGCPPPGIRLPVTLLPFCANVIVAVNGTVNVAVPVEVVIDRVMDQLPATLIEPALCVEITKYMPPPMMATTRITSTAMCVAVMPALRGGTGAWAGYPG